MYVKEVCYLKKYELNCGEYKFKSKNWYVYEKLWLIIYELLLVLLLDILINFAFIILSTSYVFILFQRNRAYYYIFNVIYLSA